MPDPLNVTEGERETVRVFAVDLDASAAARWLEVGSNLEAALGAKLDPAHIETFPATDLAGLGLSQYLIDGYGIAEADVAPDRAALDAAQGHLLLLRARAFRGAEVALDPKPPLQVLGAYGQAKADPGAPTPSRQEEPVAPSAPAAAPPEPKGSLAPFLIFAGLAVVILTAMIWPKL